MDINLQQNLGKKFSNSNFITILGGALEEMQYFVVDRKEGDYTILQNRQTHKTFEVKTTKLPPFLNDGDVLKKSGFNYEFDLSKTNELKQNISNKMNTLFSNKTSNN